MSTFDNVTNLLICLGEMAKQPQHHFARVTSITLASLFGSSEESLFETKHARRLRLVVKLSTVKHMRITHSCKLESSSVSLETLKEAPCISSISIHTCRSISFFDDHELRKYFHKMITKLDPSCYGYNLLRNSDDLKLLCRVARTCLPG